MRTIITCDAPESRCSFVKDGKCTRKLLRLSDEIPEGHRQVPQCKDIDTAKEILDREAAANQPTTSFPSPRVIDKWEETRIPRKA